MCRNSLLLMFRGFLLGCVTAVGWELAAKLEPAGWERGGVADRCAFV